MARVTRKSFGGGAGATKAQNEKATMRQNKKKKELDPNFPERIGYACLNTILRAEKPPIFCSRTLRLATLKEKGMDYVFELGKQNLKDLETLIRWNDEHHIKFMRMSSEMFPFASHEEHGYSLAFCKDELQRVGDLAKQLGHRLTLHPGQFNQLGSPSAKVVEATRRDLLYHAEILDFMGLPAESIMILHMGGVYGEKEATIQRWEAEFQRLPKHVQQRLVIENDEMNYNVEEILPTCKRLNIPLVFDYHHHALNPGTRPLEELLPEIAETWRRRGIRQKVHYSESRLGAVSLMERRGHSDRVKSLPFCGKEVDLMIEAKDKEQAVLEMYQLYGCFPVKKNLIWKALPEATRVCDKVAHKVKTTKKKTTTKSRTTEEEETTEVVEEAEAEAEQEEAETTGRGRKRRRMVSRLEKVAIREENVETEELEEETVRTTRRISKKTKKKHGGKNVETEVNNAPEDSPDIALSSATPEGSACDPPSVKRGSGNSTGRKTAGKKKKDKLVEKEAEDKENLINEVGEFASLSRNEIQKRGSSSSWSRKQRIKQEIQEEPREEESVAEEAKALLGKQRGRKKVIENIELQIKEEEVRVEVVVEKQEGQRSRRRSARLSGT